MSTDNKYDAVNAQGLPAEPASIGIAPMAAGDEFPDPKDYVRAPYSASMSESESVSLNNGSLQHTVTDFVLPGKNGFDLNITRRYDSYSSNSKDIEPVPYSAKLWQAGIRAYDLTLEFMQTTAVPSVHNRIIEESNQLFIDEFNAESHARYNLLDYWEREYSTRWATYRDTGDTWGWLASLPGSSRDPSLYRMTKVTRGGRFYPEGIETQHTQTYSNTTERDNRFFVDNFGLGYGWSFALPSMEVIAPRDRMAGKTFVHLADGRSFILRGSALYLSSDKAYTKQDVVFKAESGQVRHKATGVTKSYSHVIVHKNGHKDYFLFSQSGTIQSYQLVARSDIFDNMIFYDLRGRNGMSIVDTWGRTIALTRSGNEMVWSLPESRSIRYITDGTTLSQVYDQIGRRTAYTYETQHCGAKFLREPYDTGNASIPYTLLKSVQHPTGAVTNYNYNTLTITLNNQGGYKVQPVLASRSDSADGKVYNSIGYSYATTSHYISKATVDQGNGVEEIHVFNEDNRLTEMTVAVDSKNASQVTCTYGTEDHNSLLPVHQVEKRYNADGVTFAQKETAITYSTDKKMDVIQVEETYPQNTALNKTVEMEYGANSILTEKRYKRNAATEIKEQNTLRPDGKAVEYVRLYENGVLREKTRIVFNGENCVEQQIRYYGDDIENGETIITSYKYEAPYCHQPTSTKLSGVLDADGNLAHGDGVIERKNTFDSYGRTVSSTDAKGRTSYVHYDGLGRVVRSVNTDGTESQTEYNDSQNYVISTNELGNRTKTEFTALGLTKATYLLDPETKQNESEYDSLQRLITEQTFDVQGNVLTTTTHTYDKLNRKVRQETVGDGVNRAESYSFNDAYQNKYFLVEKTVHGDTNAPDVVSSSMSDQAGNVIEETIGNATTKSTYDLSGNKVSVTDPMGRTSFFEFDYAGRQIKATNALGHSSQAVYDTLGYLVSEIDMGGQQHLYTNDIAGRSVMAVMPFDESRKSISKTYYDADGKTLRELTLVRDDIWQVRMYRYDDRGRKTEVLLYDEHGGCVRSVFTFDAVGNQLSECSGLNENDDPAVDGVRTLYTYNRFCIIESITDPMGNVERNHFDPNGRLLSKTDRNGDTTTFQYNALGIVTSQAVTAVASGVTTEQGYTYAANGQKVSERVLETRNGVTSQRTISYQYDNMGRTVRQNDPDGVVKAYEYDPCGCRTRFVLARNGATEIDLTYEFDELNQLTAVKKNGAVIAEYTYDNQGNRTSLAYPVNHIATTYKYNHAGLLTKLENRRNGTPVSSWAYTYQLDNNQTSKTDLDGNTVTYEYSLLGQLVKEEDPTWNTIAYTYDKQGNRSKMSVAGAEEYETEYTYNVRNQLLLEIKRGEDGSETTRYRYDANGNQTAKEWEKLSEAGESNNPGRMFFAITGSHGDNVALDLREYNGLNQMTKVYRDGEQTLYQYRPDGLRHSKSTGKANHSRDNDLTTTHVWDGAQMVMETGENGNVKARYLRGNDLICQVIDDKDFYYLFDGHHDVVQRVDPLGNSAPMYHYDAFGNEKEPVATDPNPFRYCGEYFDKETGEYYLRARSYNSKTGRFTSEDPARSESNLYGYCAGNPIQYYDPNGMYWFVYDYHKSEKKYRFMPEYRLGVTLNTILAGSQIPLWSQFYKDMAIDKPPDYAFDGSSMDPIHYFDTVSLSILDILSVLSDAEIVNLPSGGLLGALGDINDALDLLDYQLVHYAIAQMDYVICAIMDILGLPYSYETKDDLVSVIIILEDIINGNPEYFFGEFIQDYLNFMSGEAHYLKRSIEDVVGRLEEYTRPSESQWEEIYSIREEYMSSYRKHLQSLRNNYIAKARDEQSGYARAELFLDTRKK